MILLNPDATSMDHDSWLMKFIFQNKQIFINNVEKKSNRVQQFIEK